MSVTILTVDDNPLVGEALASVCNDPGSDMSVHGHFLDGEGVVETASQVHPDVILMDLDMPGTDTLALIREVCEAVPDTHVLMLSAHLRGQDILACIDAGAVGYIHKDREPEYIREAIVRAARGEFVLCDEAAHAAGWA